MIKIVAAATHLTLKKIYFFLYKIVKDLLLSIGRIFVVTKQMLQLKFEPKIVPLHSDSSFSNFRQKYKFLIYLVQMI